MPDFWVRSGRPSLVLAPMEGVIDAPMRAFLSERGGFTHCVSEFLRVSSEALPPKLFHRHVPELRAGSLTPSGLPVHVQLLGGDPALMAQSAERACQLGALAIDINFGCPAPTVNRHDGGASLLRFPDRIRAIVAAVRAQVPSAIPVSAKLRLGWENPEDIHLNAERAAEGGASWLTIHARTKMQGYSNPVRWEPIGEVRRRLSGPAGIPVIANGEIITLEDFRRCREMTGCEHFMLGRGVLADLGLPERVARELGVEPVGAGARGEGVETGLEAALRRFAEICEGHADGSQYTLRRIKQWLGMAHQKRPFPEPLDWLTELRRSQTLDEAFSALSRRR